MSATPHEAKKATTDADSIVTNLDSDADASEIAEAVAALATEVADLQATVEDQQATIEDQQATIEDQQATIEDQQATIEDLEDTIAMRGREVAQTRQQVEEVRETVSVEETPTPREPQTDTLTPVEQLARADDVEAVTDSASVRRAVTLFRNLDEWGRRAPKGLTLKPSDNPLSLLEAACEESLCWKQWYRCSEALERLSEGAVTFFDSDRHGKMVCLHEQSEVYDRVTSGELSPSSARAEV